MRRRVFGPLRRTIYTLLYQKEQQNMAANWEQIRAPYQKLQVVWEDELFRRRPDGDRRGHWDEELCGGEALLAGLELEDLL